jgi:DNA invertase Pin-like site-specific DNA recombinase
MMVGYARVSTHDQNLELQLAALRRAGCDKVLFDVGVSGAIAHRPALSEVLTTLRSDDVLVVWRLDRLGRSLSHLISLITDFEQRGVAFKSLCEAIDTSTAPGRLMFHVLGALAEFERSLIRERTTAGLAAARAKGRVLGRPSKLTAAQIEIAADASAQASLSDLASSLSISKSTLRRALRKRALIRSGN